MRVASIVGARPQFIKAAVVSRALAHAGVPEDLIHTGQHFDAAMSDVFFRELGLPAPSVHLGIGGLSHGAMTGRMLEEIEKVLVERRPDWVVVYGDTNSTLAGALAASKLHIKVAHVEAGMRSFNRRMPEEINRVLTDHLSSLNLVSSPHAATLLAAEGITRHVEVVGDVMYDAFLAYADAARRTQSRERHALEDGAYVLATVHRAENIDSSERLTAILAGLVQIAERLPVVLPVHPRTRKALAASSFSPPSGRLLLIEPIGYLEMLDLERSAAFIVTDSGGVQKEAYFAGVPCLTLREETEWTETVELGWNRLTGTAPNSIGDNTDWALASATRACARPAVYGDGTAAARVVERLRKYT